MTTPDFQTQLRLQLREAARREERRSALAPPTGWWRGLSPTLVALAVTLLALVLVLAGLAMRGPNPDRTANPRTVERVPVAGSLGPVARGYGAVWAIDKAGRLLRLDPVSRDVTASIDVPVRAALAAGAGSLWVGDFDNNVLTRINPRTGRVVARIPMRTPDGEATGYFDLQFTDRYLWASGPGGLLRINLRRNAVDRFVRGGDSLLRGWALGNGALWVIGRNDRLLRLDPRTGARLGSVRVSWPPQAGLYAENGVALTSSSLDGRMARVDLPTGRELWVRDVGGKPGWWTVAGRDVWVQVSTGHGRDRLVRLDAGTGRVVSKTELPDIGVTSMTVVDDQVWVGTPGGKIDVVSFSPR